MTHRPSRLRTFVVLLLALALHAASLGQEANPTPAFAFTGSANARLEDRPGAWTRIQTVTFTALRDGWIHLEATGYLTIYDPAGEGARYWFLIGDDDWSDPRYGREGMNVASYEPEPPLESATSRHPIATQRVIAVPAGTHTFHAIGYHETGERATATYEQVTITATFHADEASATRPVFAAAPPRNVTLWPERDTFVTIASVNISIPREGTVHVQATGTLVPAESTGPYGVFWLAVTDMPSLPAAMGAEGAASASYRRISPTTSSGTRVPIATQRAMRLPPGTHTLYALGWQQATTMRVTFSNVVLTATFFPGE